jgi:N-acetylmuramoyl-L-alanine amidase
MGLSIRIASMVAAVALGLPAPAWANSGPHRTARTSSHTASKAVRPAVRAASGSRLDRARAAMAALLRDRNRRRYHHHWDRAIAGLVAAARGPDRPAALLEAARARYALYRWSADEADREAALKLAAQAGKAGAGEGTALAAAIRREAGDDRPAPAPERKRPGQRAPAAPAATAAAPAAPEEEEPPDPALDHLENALAEAGEAAPAAEATQGPARVTEVKAWSSPDYTRVAIYLSHWVGWQRLELPADAGHPRRLALDLEPALLAGRTLERPVGGLRLSRVRAAQYDPDTVRVVLDLAGDDRVQLFRLDDPPRLVLDLAAPGPRSPLVASVASGAAAAREGSAPPVEPAEPAQPAAAPEGGREGLDTRVELPPRARAMLENGFPEEEEVADGPVQGQAAAPPGGTPAAGDGAQGGEGEEEARPIRRIVVDAGHGGHDPGAIGPSRIKEKNVTLAIARRLAGKLREAGYAVVLTRKDDRYLALEERTALANTARGDLFVSIHANANPRRAWNGVETYFLNVTDDRYAARLAARENGVDLSAAGDLARILTDLDAKASAGASQRLARLVQREVCGGVRSRVGDVRDLGVKSALFYVLLGARMPAVLVETGFISNRAEEKRLASERYQDEVASGIARAVETFTRAEARVARR